MLRRFKRSLAATASALMLTSAASDAQLGNTIATVDGDRIGVSARNGRGDGEVSLCLHAPHGMALRQLRIVGSETLQASDGATRCLTVPAREIRVEFIKLEKSGVAVTVGQTKLDLSGYGSGTVTLTWGAR